MVKISTYVKNKSFFLNAFQLKIIACFTMLLDHIAYMIIYNGMLYGYDVELFNAVIKQPEAQQILIVYKVLRCIGRISFPIFSFLLVEGFVNTRNFNKYLFRMVLCAIISEIPFNLVTGNSIRNIQAQNVLFTLAIGLICMHLCEKLKHNSIANIIKLLIFFVGAFLCYQFNTDYKYFGIALIFVFYFFRDDKLLMYIFAAVICILESKNFYGTAIFSLVFISFYNYKRGPDKLKYFFYFFYPVHLLILYLIVWIPSYLKTVQ